MLTLAKAQSILADTLAHARAHKFNPMAVVVLDARGALVAAATEDGNSLGRWQIALAKASGSLFLGSGSKRLGVMAAERPHFIGALAHLPTGGMIPVAGGVLVRDPATNAIIGAVGVSGDTSDNDEAAAAVAIAAAGFKADGG